MIEPERPPRADFHVHSTASDGTLAPGEIVRLAAHRGLSYLAITDHDTVRGIQEALDVARASGVEVIAGVELSTATVRGELHLLGYGIDPAHAELTSTLDSLREARATRAWKILERLASMGIELDPEVLAREHENDSIGRPHIARALMTIGVVESVNDAFERYLGADKPAYVGRELLIPADAIALIRDAGGLSVMAHPLGVPHHSRMLQLLVDLGLNGLECYYGGYAKPEQEALAREAAAHRLVTTGGSDYHGPGEREGRELGSVEIPPDAVHGFLRALARRR